MQAPWRSHYFGYGFATRNRPELYAGYLTFQNGIPFTRTASLIGGGTLVRRNWTGTFPPQVAGYSTPISSIVGGGNIVARPGFLQSLVLNPNKAQN